MQKVLRQSFLKDVGAYTDLSCESLVLQQKTGYSTVYRVWQELKFYLDLFGNQSSISMKSVAEIYEVWCFLCIKQILEEDLGFTLVEKSRTTLSQNAFWEYQMEDGFAGAFHFQRFDGVTARLAHEQTFSKRSKPIRTYLVSQRPDIVLEVSLPETAHFGEGKQFIWLFDAKYRIKTEKNRFDEDDEDTNVTDYVPDDAINQMHRYRDALIHQFALDGKSDAGSARKSRPVFGAFALYPGFFDQANTENPYLSAIEEIGIGAFALLPSQGEDAYCGHKWLRDFLQTQIGIVPLASRQGCGNLYPAVAEMEERLYVQESVRIPFYGMRQVLYPDLTLTVSLGGQRGRNKEYFERFKQGTAEWYHLPQMTFLKEFKLHVAEEIRYLALALTSDAQSATKQIDKVWPVKGVRLVPRYSFSEEQAGKLSDSEDLYYLFELGKPLSLPSPVVGVPHRPIRNSMKLTTLTCLEGGLRFVDLNQVYKQALG